MEYIGNVSDLPRKPGRLTGALSGITGYKVYMQKPTAFLGTATQQLGIKLLKKKKHNTI